MHVFMHNFVNVLITVHKHTHDIAQSCSWIIYSSVWIYHTYFPQVQKYAFQVAQLMLEKDSN